MFKNKLNMCLDDEPDWKKQTIGWKHTDSPIMKTFQGQQ